jgi:hypothetical protein
MKNNNLKRYFFSIAIIALLALVAGDAFGADLTSRRGNTSTKAVQAYSNDKIVQAPYWQVDSGSYTFIAVSHSSLSGMASQIGLTINAIDSTGAAYDTAESFTIFSGNTERVFIVPTNHATVNSTSITTAKFLAGTTDFTYGHVRVNPIASHPNLKFTGGPALKNFSREFGNGFRDITMLTYWGSVIIEANTTGFAMEFVGDMNDSQTPSVLLNGSYMSSGVNLQ